MSRNLASLLVDELEKSSLRPVVFVYIGLDSGDIRLHTDLGTLTWGGDDWLGVGDFGGIETLQEGAEISPYEVELILSGLDSDLLSEALATSYYGKPVTIYVGAVDPDDGTLVADPDQIWNGKADNAQIGIGEANAIRLTCESELAVLEKVSGRTFSDADLQGEYSGDTFFSFLEDQKDKRVVWRGQNATAGTVGGGGGRVTNRTDGGSKWQR